MTTHAACDQGEGAASMAFVEALELCVGKARGNIRRLAAEPKAAAVAREGDYFQCAEGFFDIGNWTSSFFTAMAALAYLKTRDGTFLEQLERLAEPYRRKVFERHLETTQDLGFLYSLYSVAMFQITGEARHRATGLRAAELLAGRVQPGGCLHARGRMDERNAEHAAVATIEGMMNLPLLFWAAGQTKNVHFQRVAVQHADATLAHFVRPDGSVYSGFRFDAKGQPLRPEPGGGRAPDSHWARGTAWAFYGFTLAYRHTRDERYLEAAQKIARNFLHCLDAEVVPLWEFRLPGDPPLRDSSAAAIAICGLQELLRHLPGEAEFATGAQRLLMRLCMPDYLDARADCPGLLKNGHTGKGPDMATNTYTSWGDYFLMEALVRELKMGDGFW